MFKRVLFSVFFLCCVLSARGQSSTKQLKTINTDIQYTQEEIDSLLPSILEYYNKGEYEYILTKVPKLITNAKEIDAFITEVRLLNFLGNTFIKLGDTKSAKEYFNDALNISEERNDSTAVITMYVSLGNTFYDIEPQKAIEYYNKALNYGYRGERYKASLFIINHNLAELYVKEKNAEKAKFHLDQIIDKVDEQEPPQLRRLFTGTVKCIEAGVNLLQNDHDTAIKNALESLKSREEYDLEYEAVNYQTLIKAYKNTGQYKNALFFNTKYDSLRKVQFENEKIVAQQIARAKIDIDAVQDELNKAEKENDLAEQRAGLNKIVTIFFVLLTMLLMVAAILLFREKNKRDQLLKVLTQKNEEYLSAKNESEELARSNTRFLSTISHELRTPLYGIVGLTSAFLKDHRLKDFQGDLSSLKFSADYLLALVNDVLNMNKFSSINGQEIIEKHFDLQRLLTNIRESFRFLNEKHNNKIKIEVDPQIPRVLLTDYTKVSQVLMNLMSNASKFTEDGSITISVRLIEEKEDLLDLNFEVSDSGRGIHPDDQKRIFEEFTQVKGSNDFEIEGTGLGIPIVNKILQLLKSNLEIESELNEGSKFSFNLQVKKGNINEIKQEIETDHLKSLHGLRVLIVDDNKINQLVTKKVLELHRMIHHTASNGKEAVAISKDFDFDFILMDINMPVMNGIDATIEIRKHDPQTPIIALTATNFEDPEKEIYCHGFNSIVVKPYNNEHLIQAFLQQLEMENES